MHSVLKEESKMTLTDKELKEAVNGFEAEDQALHAKRVSLLSKMEDLRAINDCMSEWTRTTKLEWEALNKECENTLAARLEFNKKHTSVGSACVPSLKTLHSQQRVGSNTMDEMPHWFNTVAISSEASKMAWYSMKRGECKVDVSSPGGKAVDALYTMLSQAKTHWVESNPEKSFDWNSHDYNAEASKKSIGARLNLGSHGKDSELPREYKNDFGFYARAAVDDSIAHVFKQEQVEEKKRVETAAIPSIDTFLSPSAELVDLVDLVDKDDDTANDGPASPASKMTPISGSSAMATPMTPTASKITKPPLMAAAKPSTWFATGHWSAK
jgi:hypothetical protein